MVHPGRKGKSGEKQACEWIQSKVFLNRRQIRINHNQAFLGCDIFAEPFIFEIKRRESLALDKWWMQINTVYKRLADFGKMYIPVVMFRQNFTTWEFLISAQTIGAEYGYIRITEARFIEWARKLIA